MGKKKKDKKYLKHLLDRFGYQACEGLCKAFKEEYGAKELKKVMDDYEKRCY